MVGSVVFFLGMPDGVRRVVRGCLAGGLVGVLVPGMASDRPVGPGQAKAWVLASVLAWAREWEPRPDSSAFYGGGIYTRVCVCHSDRVR